MALQSLASGGQCMLVQMGEWQSDISVYSICEIVRQRTLTFRQWQKRSGQAIDFDRFPYTIRITNDTSRFYLMGEDVSIDTDDADICLGGAWGTHGKVELRYKASLRRVEIKAWAAVGYEREAQKAWESLVKELIEKKSITKVWELETLESSSINDEFAPNEYQFNGTPTVFASKFRQFNDANPGMPKNYLDGRDINCVKAWINGGTYVESLFLESRPVPPSCLITASIEPGGVVSKLKLQLETPPMYVVSPFVENFISYLKKEGWIVGTIQQKRMEETKTRSEVASAKHEPLQANQWLFEQVFDNGRNPKELVDEWLKIRKSKDFKEPPVNPLKSMSTAISEERKRRNQK